MRLFHEQSFQKGKPRLHPDEFLTAHPETYEIDAEYCDSFGHNVTWCTNAGCAAQMRSGQEMR